MKYLFILLLLFCFNLRAQQADTINVPVKQFVDNAFAQIQGQFTTGFLGNKTLGLDSNALERIKNTNTPWNASHFYTAYNVLDLMATDSNFVTAEQLYEMVHLHVMQTDWDLDIVSVPIGIVDVNYEEFNDSVETANNTFSYNNGVLLQNTPITSVESKRFSFLGPMFDYKSATAMELYFDSSYFYSNHKTIADIASIVVSDGTTPLTISMGESYLFMAKDTSFQQLNVKITYTNNEVLEKDVLINTPFLEVKSERYTNGFFGNGPGRCPEFFSRGYEENGNKMQICYIPSCSNEDAGGSWDGPQVARIKRPFILVTGWRPPFLGQSFETTWENYSNKHNDYLATLREYDYDIFLVRFNVHIRPLSHGMIESAELLEQFINELNDQRKKPYEYENVIQGSSMGADIVRLCLLNMEKKHFDGLTDSHHHCRLNMSYDANFYGANIPLAYQYQIRSNRIYPSTYALVNPLNYYLNFLLSQKSLKQLLTYHPDNYAETVKPVFFSPFSFKEIEPKPAAERLTFLNALNNVDNNNSHVALPMHLRNSSISLGVISGLSSDLNNLDERNWTPRDDYFRNLGPLSQIKSATYTTGFNHLFRRNTVIFVPSQLFGIPIFLPVAHNVKVKNMQELDNAPGSYITGGGNLIAVARGAYHPVQLAAVAAQGRSDLFSHKSVNTALAINQNLWPSNGSHTNDLHELGLMGFEKPFDVSDQSNFYGYPNIGRPNDHFDITPFEAIYCDRQPDPHINLENRPQSDKNAKNEFLLDEIMPYTVEIQNIDVGSQVRSDIAYISRRDALDTLKIGENVSVKTDVAPVKILPNAKVKFYAQEIIEIKPGTHFTAGCSAHLKIEDYACFTQGKSMLDGVITNTDAPIALTNFELAPQNKEHETGVTAIPNPNNGACIISTATDKIMRIAIYNMNGKRVFYKQELATQRLEIDENLEAGVYIAKVKLSNNKVETLKIIVQ